MSGPEPGRTGPERPIVQERIYAAPPERVFAAWSDPEALALIMRPAPDMSEPARVELDFRVGGRFRIAMRGSERDYVQTGEYLAIDPPKSLAFSWVSDFVAEACAYTRVSVRFEPAAGGGTRLVLVHDRLPAPEVYDGHVAGWARILDLLDARVAGQESRT